MRDELLAYLLNDLDARQRARVEERLQQDPVWRNELERLRSCLESGEVDPHASDPPPDDLADRTCSLVKRTSDRVANATNSAKLPEASLSDCPPCNTRSNWSLGDVALAAGAVTVLVMLLLPALQKSRDGARRQQCQNNLRTLGTAMVEYAERTPRRNLPLANLNENAGIFVVKLADSGSLSRQELHLLLVCPSSSMAEEVFSGRIVIQVPTRQQLESARANALARMRKLMAGTYASDLGYWNEQGKFGHVKFVGRGNLPMLADAPSYSVAGFQSANHGAGGQYVVCQDLSVSLCNDSISQDSEDHIYLNDEGQQAAGRHPRDFVLGRSEMSPKGPLTSQ